MMALLNIKKLIENVLSSISADFEKTKQEDTERIKTTRNLAN